MINHQRWGRAIRREPPAGSVGLTSDEADFIMETFQADVYISRNGLYYTDAETRAAARVVIAETYDASEELKRSFGRMRNYQQDTIKKFMNNFNMNKFKAKQ